MIEYEIRCDTTMSMHTLKVLVKECSAEVKIVSSLTKWYNAIRSCNNREERYNRTLDQQINILICDIVSLYTCIRLFVFCDIVSLHTCIINILICDIVSLYTCIIVYFFMLGLFAFRLQVYHLIESKVQDGGNYQVGYVL
ncbi:hypothetical protein Hanom_Chr13g01187151 [Helianthus anomalus]